DDDAADWIEKGKELVAAATEEWKALPADLADLPAGEAVSAALANCAFSVKDSTAFAVFTFSGVTKEMVVSFARNAAERL
ncbi:MAG: hypothetical protein JNK78_00030, partial [Planctomycetes bacterium]|nr:hypothetical protein [Planctomycetota bacterium]